MARKIVSEMTLEEKEQIFGKKKRFTPLFEVPEKNIKTPRKKKESEDILDTNLDKVSRKKKKPTINVDNLDKVSNPKTKKSKKPLSMDKDLDKVSKLKKKKKSKKEIKEALEKAKALEKANKKAQRLAKRKIEEIEIPASERKAVIKFKILYDKPAHEYLIEFYNKVTIKKTKSEKALDEAGLSSRVRSGLLVALHEHDAGPERFSMMGKLVEKNYAVHKAYATDYHLFEIYK